MPTYRILQPVVHGSRREKGELVEAPEGKFSPEEAVKVQETDETEEAQQPAEDEPEEEETDETEEAHTYEEMSLDDLKALAEQRGVAKSGAKHEIIERLQLQDEEDQSDDSEE